MSEKRLEDMTLEELEREAELAFSNDNEDNGPTEPTESVEETPEVTEDTPEEPVTENEPEQPEEPTETEEKPSTYKIKADGKEYDFSIDDLVKLAPMAMNYTKKMQDIAPYRKMITAIGENEISQEDINTLIDIKKGNKEALGAFIKKLGIDPLDIEADESKQYQPNDYGVDENTYRLNEIVKELERDADFTQTAQVIQSLDNSSKAFLKSNPEAIRGLHQDIKSKMFDKILTEAEKLSVLDGGKHSFLDYYITAGQEIYKREVELQKTNQAQKAEKEAATRAKKVNAGLPKNAASTAHKVINYIDDIDDEDFKAWKKSVDLD